MKNRGKRHKQLAKEVKKLRSRLADWERRAEERRPAEATPAPRPVGYLPVDLVMILDRDQRVLAVAGPWLERFALTPESFLGRAVQEFLEPSAFTAFAAAYRRVLSGREEVYDSPWMMAPLPEARHLQLALAPLRDAQGAVVGVVAVGRDVTEGVRLGARQTQEHKLEALGRMASGVVHHFNNLLTPVLGFAELLLRNLRPDDPMREFAEQIRSAADRATGLLRPLQIFAGGQVVTPQAVDLGNFLDNVAPALRSLLGQNVRLVLEPASGLWPVRADPALLSQMVVNLAVNAREAMSQGGVLTLTATNGTEGLVRLAVSDTGAGLSAAVREHLFEPFFTTKPLNQGPGLGLAVVYGIVNQLGGRIEVASRPEQGTTFTVSLPRA